MSEFEDIFRDEFFVIDTNNLHSFNKNFFGYAFINNKIVFEVDDFDLLNGNGVYLAIKEDDDFITIYQNYNGSYGLHLYQNGDYFAISNSFMKLVEHLKDNHEITLNKEVADSFLFSDLCSIAYKDTLVNEIELLPRNYKVLINKNDKKIDFEEIDYQERSIPIDSKEAFEILDKWYYKWIDIVRSIKKESNNLSVDLSGGFDSRIVSIFWLTANIDLDKIRIKSHNDNLHGHKEDYIIASKIANDFNFKLNQDILSYDKTRFNDVFTPIDISFYSKLGFHKQMYLKLSRSKEPMYTITGDGGGPVKGFLYKTKEENIQQVIDIANRNDTSTANSTYNVITKAINRIKDNYNLDENSKTIPEIHFREIRNRLHYGKSHVESVLSNWITLDPLIDFELNKIDVTNCECNIKAVLLYSIIFTRYCPQLLEYEFEGNRVISQEVLDYSKKLNEKYPFKPKNLEFISGPDLEETKSQPQKNFVKKADVENLILKVFHSNKFKNEFLKHFSKTSYYSINKIVQETNYHPLRHVYSAIAILKVINDVSNPNQYKDMNEWLTELSNDTSNDLDPGLINDLLKYDTARVDIKNYGNEKNKLEIIDASQSRITYPDWFENDKGTGLSIEAIQSPLDLKIKCINDGEVKLRLKGIDFRDTDRERFPIYIDYTNLTINGETYSDAHRLVTHDKPAVITKEVKDSEILNIHIEWAVVNKSSSYDSVEKKIDKLKSELNTSRNEINSLQRKNDYLSNTLNNVYESNSWKLTSIFRKIGRLLR